LVRSNRSSRASCARLAKTNQSKQNPSFKPKQTTNLPLGEETRIGYKSKKVKTNNRKQKKSERREDEMMRKRPC